MLSGVEARGQAAARAAADRARVRMAVALRRALPGVAVGVEGEQIVLTGRISPDDARLRWIGEFARMSAESVVQAAALAAVRGVAGLNAVHSGPPVKATPPYAELGDLLSGDWGVKDRPGREIRLAVTLRDTAETPARVQALAEAVCDAIEALPRDLGGWGVASLVLLRARVAGGPAGRWTATVEYRLRVLAA